MDLQNFTFEIRFELRGYDFSSICLFINIIVIIVYKQFKVSFSYGCARSRLYFILFIFPPDQQTWNFKETPIQ